MDQTLISLPNIGKSLVDKLNRAGIYYPEDLIACGSENALLRIAEQENSGACINMLYALEGAIQGIRWHSLSKERKEALLHFYRMKSQEMPGLPANT